MVHNWKWKPNGLYDGNVPILWVTQTLQGELLLGRSADFEDAILAVPELLEACEALAPVATSQYFNFQMLIVATELAKAAIAKARAEWPTPDGVDLTN